jgi:threonyl-tRNA synthetase
MNKDLEKIRHSLAHLLAAAVLKKYPDTKFGIGPTIEDGFYYDFQFSKAISSDDLKDFEKSMREFIAEKLTFKKQSLAPAQAKKLFKNQLFKLELIGEFKKAKKPIMIYDTYKPKNYKLKAKSYFMDLCAGPHIKNTKEIDPQSFKLTKIAGAYWRGSEKNPMLTRIYGVAFENKKTLDNYLKLLAEAEKRDHRRLGQELDLFSTHEEYGPGLIYWHPKGSIIRVIMENFWREAHLKNGYEIIYTPHIGKSTLWKTSGHLDFYKESMYSSMKIDEDEYYIKPMNCPFHILIYKNKIRSYRNLPLRWAELGTVYRYEKAGVLHGLLRVRGFTQDDAHIICQPEKMPEEIKRVIDFSLYILKSFGFEKFNIYLADQPKKSIGSKKMWQDATNALKKALEKRKLEYILDKGGGAFYGPKIDIKIKDALGREWQCSTIQFDFNMPERFDMTYVGKDGKPHRPYMIHRALMGSLERFFGTMIEHYAGAFPLWLAPIQCAILPISEKFANYAKSIHSRLLESDIRVEFNENETLNKRIREAELQKIPYILVVGEREMKNNSVNVRHYKRGVEGEIKLDMLIEKIKKEIIKKGSS